MRITAIIRLHSKFWCVLSSCLLSASYPARFSTLVYSTLIFLPTLASFPSSHRALLVIVGTAAAVAVAFVVVVVPVDLFFLNTILISAMLPIPPSTHILFLFSFFSFAVPHTASTLFYLFDLLANPSIGSMSRPPVLGSLGHLALYIKQDPRCVQHRSAPVRTLPKTNFLNTLDPP